MIALRTDQVIIHLLLAESYPVKADIPVVWVAAYAFTVCSRVMSTAFLSKDSLVHLTVNAPFVHEVEIVLYRPSSKLWMVYRQRTRNICNQGLRLRDLHHLSYKLG